VSTRGTQMHAVAVISASPSLRSRTAVLTASPCCAASLALLAAPNCLVQDPRSRISSLQTGRVRLLRTLAVTIVVGCSLELWVYHACWPLPIGPRSTLKRVALIEHRSVRPEARALRPAQCGLVRDLWHPAVSAPFALQLRPGSRPCCHPLFLSILTSTLATSGSPRLVELATLHACFTPRADFDRHIAAGVTHSRTSSTAHSWLSM
jgi:hypothetical protein